MRSVLQDHDHGIVATNIHDAGPGEYDRMGWGLDESGERCGAGVYAVCTQTDGRRGGIGRGNPPTTGGDTGDDLTLRVLDATGQRTLAAVTQRVSTANYHQVMFVIPKGGLNLSPGQT
jgi:hypothetical protein